MTTGSKKLAARAWTNGDTIRAIVNIAMSPGRAFRAFHDG